jgi:fructokinase
LAEPHTLGKYFGAVEAGGTKFICAVGTTPEDIKDEIRIPTTTPVETLDRVVAFFQSYRDSIAAIGIASFGPVDLVPESPTFGFITSTPKDGWADTDIVGPLRSEFNLPVGFDTDVNGAALGEHKWGAARDLDTFVYLTIGTGIGGGALVEGKLLHGLIHPEMGHIYIPHNRNEDPFEGICPFHRDCFEGLASGPALERRWGQSVETFPSDHAAWDLEAHYISMALTTFIGILSPQRIILGGGVMKVRQLFPRIHLKVVEYLNDYIEARQITKEIEQYIVPPALEDNAGVLGAIVLAERALRETM